jgi:hypothetical protein
MFMEKEFKFEITGNDSIILDFDNDPEHIAKYQISLSSTRTQQGDKVVLSLNKQACGAFARLFAQLAEGNYENGYHLHISLTEKQKGHEGLRIVLDQDGRTKV